MPVLDAIAMALGVALVTEARKPWLPRGLGESHARDADDPWAGSGGRAIFNRFKTALFQTPGIFLRKGIWNHEFLQRCPN